MMTHIHRFPGKISITINSLKKPHSKSEKEAEMRKELEGTILLKKEQHHMPSTLTKILIQHFYLDKDIKKKIMV